MLIKNIQTFRDISFVLGTFASKDWYSKASWDSEMHKVPLGFYVLQKLQKFS